MERYFNFWRRLGAGIFDGLIFVLISFLFSKYAYFTGPISSFPATTILIFIYFSYSVLLTGLIGQTIGKIVMGVKVLDVDEKRVIGIKRAFYRDSVPFVLQMFALLYLGYQTFTQETSGSIYIVDEIIEYAQFYWLLAELLTMLFNRKRRALHDFLASSVVISLKGQRIDEHYEKFKANRNAVLK